MKQSKRGVPTDDSFLSCRHLPLIKLRTTKPNYRRNHSTHSQTMKISIEPLLPKDAEFKAQVSAFLQERAAEQKAGVPLYWLRTKPSFILYVILDCSIRHLMQEETSSLITRLHLKRLLRKRQMECEAKFRESPKNRAIKYADLVMSSMIELNFLSDMIPYLDWILEKPFDEEFESQLFAFFDKRAAEQKAGASFDWDTAKPDFAFYVVAEVGLRYHMRTAGVPWIGRLFLEYRLCRKHQHSKEKFGRSSKDHAVHYAELITETLMAFGLLHLPPQAYQQKKSSNSSTART